MRRLVRSFYSQVGHPTKITEYFYEHTPEETAETIEIIRAEHGRDVQLPTVKGGIKIVIFRKLEGEELSEYNSFYQNQNKESYDTMIKQKQTLEEEDFYGEQSNKRNKGKRGRKVR